MWEHRTKQNPGSFTARYKINKLVFYQGFHSVAAARSEEKYMKGKSRAWKIALLQRTNPDWQDLYGTSK
jgi:putative endonuclease